jgi:hypothetical protein
MGTARLQHVAAADIAFLQSAGVVAQ